MSIVVAIVAFAVMVFIHEMGHFGAAKLFKIKVNEFSIGMGPAILKKQRGETLYSLRILPLGGFCSMEGESEESDDKRSFSNAAWWKRFIVVFAGAFLNVVLGFVFLIIVQSASTNVVTTHISSFEANSNMEAAGFEVGDKIVKLNDTKINIFEDVSFFLARVDENDVKVTVKRGNETVEHTVKPVKREIKYTYFEDKTEVEVYVNGVLTQSYQTVASADKSVFGTTQIQSGYILGFTGETRNNSFLQTVSRSFYLTGYYVKLVYVSLYELVCGKVAVNQISGPVGVVSMIGQASKINWKFLLEILALLTVNLGVMNLLPIPALDGCKLIVILAEAITKKKIPPEKEGIINLIGFAVLIGIMIFATYNDIARLIFGK